MDELKTCLLYLHVEELREIADRLALSVKGNKGALIQRILHFRQTGERLIVPKFPAVSCAKKGGVYPLKEEGLMLKGAYKNDLKTRLFFQQLIGANFHFTAFGIDWLNERWMAGNPPTYREFATMWQEEYARRKRMPAAPKEEWAYINFVKKNPGTDRESLLRAWEAERLKHKKRALEALN